ncbi:uncharacterized protein LOC124910735 [Impatiens glandulifera]|uniref:uncharacterized protein LOC124910735 n=1 Tax=Impatiens glandulifera TaxID=253017 RepID=UPI001FB0B06F|nr:uncharacterized protein LOC124910735 [Impatiens glandulifera]
MENENDHLLEINLISAQGLKTPSTNLRRLQTYAIAWIDPSSKLRTRLDIVGGENPTWNEKFLFRVTAHFLSSQTSGITIEIYSIGYIKDPLLGTVRFLLSSCIPNGGGAATPAFTAVQIRRPSGRFQGVLNIAATVHNGGLGLASINGLQAISFRDLNGDNRRRRLGHRRKGSSNKSEKSSGDGDDASDGGESTTSSSSISSMALKEMNNEIGEELAGKKEMESDGGGAMLCGLFLHQRKLHFGPSDENIRAFTSSMWKRKD